MQALESRFRLTLEPLEPRALLSSLAHALALEPDLPVPTVGPQFTARFAGISDTGWVPPDPTAAAGPTNLAAMVNDHIALFSKAGAKLAEADYLNALGTTAPFFGNVAIQANGAFASDPWIVYDRYAGVFVAAVEELIPSGNSYQSYELIAISTSSSPSDLTSANWHTYAVPTTYTINGAPSFADYAKVAPDATSLYLTGNYFSGNTFEGVVITRLDKTPMLSGTLGTQTAVFAPGAASLQPVMSIGQASTAPEYFVDTWGTSGIRVWTLDSTDTLSVVATLAAPFSPYTKGAPQLGTKYRLDTLSPRLMDAWWENGAIWTAHTVASGNRSAVRWYEIGTTGGTYSILQEGTLAAPSGVFTFMPAITVDGSGNMGITYTQSSTKQYAAMMFTGRLASDPLGTTRPSIVAQAGQSPYAPILGSNPQRWGDYGGISVDPADNTTFWPFHEYPVSLNHWGTWWGSVSIASLPPALAVQAPSLPTHPYHLGHAVRHLQGIATDIGLDLDITGGA